ncbi:hypothetical protein P7K49_040131, partial [Saguinus oedipus]
SVFLLESATSGCAFRSSKHQSVGEPVPFTVHKELPRQCDSKTAVPATRVTLATCGAPPLEIF